MSSYPNPPKPDAYGYPAASNTNVQYAPVPLEMSAVAQRGDTFDPTGKYKIKFQGAFAAVEVAISNLEGPVSVKADAGTMISMSQPVDFLSKLEGSVGGALFRCCCAGASAFFTHFFIKPEYPHGTVGDVLLAPAVPGEIILLHLIPGRDWIMQKGAFLACDEGVAVGVHTQSFAQGCCSGEGFFILKATGQGRLLLNTYGSVVRYDLQPGEVRKIDNGFLVAWESSMNYTIGKSSRKLGSTFLSGEGFVTRFTGPGTVYVQTRSIEALAGALQPYLTAPSSGGGADIDVGSFIN